MIEKTPRFRFPKNMSNKVVLTTEKNTVLDTHQYKFRKPRNFWAFRSNQEPYGSWFKFDTHSNAACKLHHLVITQGKSSLHNSTTLVSWSPLSVCLYLYLFYLPHDYNNYKEMPPKKCRKKWRGGLKETIELMLIRPPQLKFFEDGIKITATDTKIISGGKLN